MGSADLPDMLTEIYRTIIITKKRWYLNLIFIILQGYTVGYVTVHNVFNYRFFRKTTFHFIDLFLLLQLLFRETCLHSELF